jgi:hypothetical protein
MSMAEYGTVQATNRRNCYPGSKLSTTDSDGFGARARLGSRTCLCSFFAGPWSQGPGFATKTTIAESTTTTPSFYVADTFTWSLSGRKEKTKPLLYYPTSPYSW